MLRTMLKFVPSERLTIEEALKSPIFDTTAELPTSEVARGPATSGIGEQITAWLKQQHGGPGSAQPSSSTTTPFSPSVVCFEFEGITGTTASLEGFIETEVRGGASGLHRAVSDAAMQGQAMADGVHRSMDTLVQDAARSSTPASTTGSHQLSCTELETMSPPEAPATKRPRTGEPGRNGNSGGRSGAT